MLGLVLCFLLGTKTTSKASSKKKGTEKSCEKQGTEWVNNL